MSADRKQEAAPELFDFVDEFLDDRERGEERPVEHYLARYPGIADEVRAEYAGLTGDARMPERAEPGSARIGRYRLLYELGRGGQGAVWAARDERLGRTVALKILPPSFAILSADRRARLRREAEIVARLDHPGICTVHEAEVDADTPYISMRLVDGAPLSKLVADERARRAGEAIPGDTPPIPVGPRSGTDLRLLLGFFERAARALHATHEAGVVHRDVKPANLMVTPAGEPVILDFGQAKDEDSAAAITASGEVFGTPAYMAPEQIEAKADELDRRVDVWALGASLHEAVTLERPFEAPTTPALLARIASGDAADPCAANPVTGEDLRVVLATAMERSLERRYPTALALAEDLRRIRLYEPIRARPAGPLLRFRRWVRRHPALAASTVGTILSLALGLVATLVVLAKERAALETALARHLAGRAEALVREDPSAALALATEAVQRAPTAQTRNALFLALDACTLRALFDGDPARRFLDLEPAPDGAHAAAALSDGTLRLYALAGGEEVRRFGAADQSARVLCFEPDGATLWTAGADATLRRFDVASGAEHGAWALGGAPVDLALSPDGPHVWVLEEDGYVTTLDRDTDELRRWPHALPAARRVAPIPGRGQAALAWSGLVPPPDADAGRWIASFTPTGTMVSQAGLSGWVRDLVIDDPGHFLYAAAGTRLHRVRCGDFGEPDAARIFERPLGSVDVSPTGALAVGEIAPGGSGLWLLDEFRADPRLLAGHDGKEVVDVAFDARGARLASCSFDRSVRTFDASSGEALRVHRYPFRPLAVAWTPDGDAVLSLSIGPTAHLWAASENPWLYRLGDGAVPFTHAAFASDGARVLVGDARGRLALWSTPPPGLAADAEPGERIASLAAHDGAVVRVRCAPDGSRWLSAGADGRLRVWNEIPSAPRRELEAEGGTPLVDAGWSADGAWIFGLAADGELFVAHAATGEARRFAGASCARFGPRGARLAFGGADGVLRIVDLAEEGREVLATTLADERGSPAAISALAFRPDGDELAVVAGRGVRLVDPATGAPTREAIVRSPPARVSYSPDGRMLIQRGDHGPKAVLLQDLERGVELRNEIWHTADLVATDVSSDGRHWLTASQDGVAYVLEVGASTPVARLALHEGPLTFARFAPGPGPRRVLTLGADGVARIWPVDPLPAALELRPRRLREWEVAREERFAAPLEYAPRER